MNTPPLFSLLTTSDMLMIDHDRPFFRRRMIGQWPAYHVADLDLSGAD